MGELIQALNALAESARHLMVVWDDTIAPGIIDFLLWDMEITGELQPW